MKIEDLRLSDDADYFCTAENTGAPGNVFTVVSDPSPLNIEHPPLVSVTPSLIVANQTDVINVVCEMFGIPRPSLTWTFSDLSSPPEELDNGTFISIITIVDEYNLTSYFTINSARHTDTGVYTCSGDNGILNRIDSPEEDTFELLIQEPVDILTNPVDVVNYTAGSAQFLCLGSGIPAPVITWFRNNSQISPDEERITIETEISVIDNEQNTTSVLTIDNLQISDTAYYHCVASNDGATGTDVAFDAVSVNASLFVEYPPLVSAAPKVTVVNATNTTAFTCLAFGIPTPQVDWIKLDDNGSETVLFDVPGVTNITQIVDGYNVTTILHFPNPQRTDQSMYVCRGVNNVTNIINSPEEDNVTFFVQVPALFITHPVSQINYTAGSLSFSCVVVGLPVPDIAWLKDDQEFLESENANISYSSSSDSVGGEAVSVVTITNLTLSDVGSYRCTANNTGALGRVFVVFSLSASLIVHYPPSVRVDPEDQVVNQTDTVTITCTIFAIPFPQVTWTDNRDNSVLTTDSPGMDIIQTDSGNVRTSQLVFPSIVKANESNYTCAAVNNITNIIGVPEEATGNIIVQVRATVNRVSDAIFSEIIGNDVVFAFFLTEDSPPVKTENIRWIFANETKSVDITNVVDNHITISEDRLNLTVIGITHTHEGRYSLEATNEAGTNSNFYILSISGQPSIISHPVDADRIEGDSVTFECFGTGDPVPTITWTFNNTVLNDSNKYTINTISDGPDFGSLTIVNLTYFDRGVYTCNVTNQISYSSNHALLRIQVVPVVFIQPETQPGIAGGSVTLGCAAFGAPLPVGIEWLKNGMLILPDKIPEISVSEIAGTEEYIRVFSNITFVDLQLDDIANYTCRANNTLVEHRFDVSDPAELTVLYPPNVDVSPTLFVVNQTQQATFTCRAFGIPIPGLTWYNTSDLSIDYFPPEMAGVTEREFVNGSGLYIKESVLQFNRSLRTDQTTYTCVAVNNITNLLGTPETGSANFYVQVPTMIVEDPVESVEHFRGGTINITCAATGLPVSSIVWYKNGELIELTDIIFTVETFSSTPISGIRSSTLVFDRLELSDTAWYFCEANNTGAPGNDFVVRSNMSSIFVTHPPNVTVTPPELTVNVTFPSTLTCTVFAIPRPEFVWTRNADGFVVVEESGRVSLNESSSGDTYTSVLHFSYTAKSDESTYNCTAINNITNVILTPETDITNLIVQVPANVTPLVASPVIGIEGNSATLSFSITDADPPVKTENIRWERLTPVNEIIDITDSDSEHFQFAKDRLSLTIVQLTDGQVGLYTLFATNEAGTRFNSIALVLEGPPVIYIFPMDQTVLEDDSVTFQCFGGGDPFPNVTWTFGGSELNPGEKYAVAEDGPSFGALTIFNVTFEDRGTYTCTYSNQHGAPHAFADLTVQVRPRVEELTVSENGTAGLDATFSCTFSGFPVPDVVWLKDGMSLPTSERVSMTIDTVEPHDSIMNATNTLHISGLVLSDRANYSCMAENDLARPQELESDRLEFLVLYPPNVNAFPKSTTINQTDSTNFTCRAFGIPVPTIQWFFNESDTALTNSTSILISDRVVTNSSGLDIRESVIEIIDSVRSSHEGVFACVATNGIVNSIGTPEMDSTTLTVQVPPLVESVTVDPLGVVNNSVTLAFRILNASPVVQLANIVWDFNGTVLDNLSARYSFSADRLALTVFDLAHSDQGLYTLTATNEAGVDSASLFLNIEAAPVIVDSPSNETRLEGENAIFICSAEAEPLHNVEWFFQDSDEPLSGSRYTIDPSSSENYGRLTVSNVAEADTGMYTCFVSNVHGNDSASAYLAVQVIPVFVTDPNDAIKLVGDSVTLSCSAYAVPAPTIVWLKDGLPLPSSVMVTSSVVGTTTSSNLSLALLEFSDTALYSCNASNELVSEQNTTSASALLTVNAPVELQFSSMNSTVNETDVVVFACEAFGLPAPEISWTGPSDLSSRSDSDPTLIINSSVTTPPEGGALTRSELRFLSIKDTDAGQYTCTASNMPNSTLGTDDSDSFTVVVQTRPQIVSLHDSDPVIGVEFRDAELTFMYTRDLPPVQEESVRWFFLSPDGIFTELMEQNPPDHYRFIFNPPRVSLKILNLTLDDSGLYTVQVSNIVGADSKNVSLDVQKAPLIIVPLIPLKQLAGTDATLVCEAEANPLHTTDWFLDGEKLTNSSKYQITGLGTAESTLIIFDLKLSDTGNYTCFAENVHGNASTSDQVFVQLPPNIVEFPLSPGNIVASSNITLRCNVTGFPVPMVDILRDGVPLLQYDDSLASDFSMGELFSFVSITLTDLDFFDTANYSCNATNFLASTETRNSDPSLYTVLYPPNTTLTPDSITTNETYNVTYYCETFGIPEPSIVWINGSSGAEVAVDIEITPGNLDHFSGFPVTTSTLTIFDATKEDETNYTCVAINNVTNLLDTPEKGTASLIVQVPPTIEAVDDQVLSVVGMNATISFTITRASPEVAQDDIQWTFVRSPGLTPNPSLNSSDRLIFSEDLLSLTIVNISQSGEDAGFFQADEGRYELTASNAAGVRSASVNLTVEAAPIFLEEPEDQQTLSGDTAVFNCSAYADPSHSVQWEGVDGMVIAEYLSPDGDNGSVQAFARLTAKRGVSVTYNNSKYHLAGQDSEFYGQLMVFDTDLSDAHNYTCTVGNVHGELSVTVRLTVQVTPEFLADGEPQDVNASAAQNVTFFCNVEGLPLPTIVWYMDGQEVVASDKLVIETVSSEQNKTNSSSLTIMNAVRSNEGTFWCNASNFLFETFEVMSTIGTLVVNYPPNVTSLTPEFLQRIRGQFAVFSCMVTGRPRPLVQWSRNNNFGLMEVSPTPFKHSIQESVQFSTDGPDLVSSTLTIGNLSNIDDGQYTCRGLNEYNISNFINARESAMVYLAVFVPPRVMPGIDPNNIVLWGNSFTIVFSISNAQPQVVPDDISWLFVPCSGGNSTNLTRDTPDGFSFSEDRLELTIDSVSLENEGTYTMKAENPGGANQASVSIEVRVPPAISESEGNNDVRVELGGTVNFTCSADGLPSPTLTWLRDGALLVEVPGRVQVSVATQPAFRPSVSDAEVWVSTVTLRDVERSDNNTELYCVAENGFGDPAILYPRYRLIIDSVQDPCASNPCQNGGDCHMRSATTYECICSNGFTGSNCEQGVLRGSEISPIVIAFPQPIYEPLFTRTNMSCLVEGNPTPEIQWVKDGAQLQGEVSPVLLIPELVIENRGYYHCTVTTSYSGGRTMEMESDSVLVNIQGVSQYIAEVAGNPTDLPSAVEAINHDLVGVNVIGDVNVFSVETKSGDDGDSAVLITLLTPNGGNDEVTEALWELLSMATDVEFSDLSRFDGCAYTSELISGFLLSWPETDIGQVASVECPCGNGSLGMGHPVASRTCTGDFLTSAQWSAAPTDACSFSASEQSLCQASMIANAEEMVQELESITSEPAILSPLDVAITVSSLESVLQEALSDPDMTSMLLDVVDNLLRTDPNTLLTATDNANVSARVLRLLEQLTAQVPLTAGSEFVYTGLMFSVAAEEISMADSQETGYEMDFRGSTSISLPESLFRGIANVTQNSTFRITRAAFENGSIFPSPELAAELGGAVIAASVVGYPVDNLQDPVVLTFPKNEFARGNATNFQCSFWDFTLNDNFGAWSSEGCSLRSGENATDENVVCVCHHLTHFGFLAEAFEPATNATSTPVPEALMYLEIVSVALVAVSLVFLLLIFVTHVASRKLRAKHHARLFANTCLTFFALYVVYIGATYTQSTLCVVFSALLNYMLLVGLVSLTAEILHLLLSKHLDEFSTAYVVTAVVASWVIPLLYVGFLISTTYMSYGSNSSSLLCSPSGIPLFVGMVGPLGVFSILAVILLATVGLLIVLGKLPKEETRSKALREVLMSALFVTGWGVALAKANASGNAAVVLAATFMVVGAPLGLYMFIACILGSRTTRNVWKRWAYRLVCRKYEDDYLEEEDVSTNMSRLSKTPSLTYKSHKPPLRLPPLEYKMPNLKSPSPTSPISPTPTAETLNTSSSSVAEHGVDRSRASSVSKSIEGSVDMPVADESQPEVPSVPYKHPSITSNDIDPPDPNEETAL